MADIGQSLHSPMPSNYLLAPIHRVDESTPLLICTVVRTEAGPDESPFIQLRDLPGAQIYLGAICDARGRIQEWVEIGVQTLQIRELAFSGYQEQLSNLFFDQRWQAEGASLRKYLPQTVIATKMETESPGPILIKRSPAQIETTIAPIETTNWRICTDDMLLQSFGLPPYTTTPFRYLHEPVTGGTKTFLATSPDAPTNSHVQSWDHLKNAPDVYAVFNPYAGLVRVTRHTPLELEQLVQILEGKTWQTPTEVGHFWHNNQYSALQAWSSSPKGLPFLLHGNDRPSERLNEIFFLKLSLIYDAFKAVRAYVKEHQLPLLNLSPASFHVCLQETGAQFPTLWSAQCRLVKPGQAYPLKIKSTEQRYFIRLGRIEPSPFLPEGVGAHSFGIGGVQVRSVTNDTDGVALEGTLVAEDYLGLDPHDLLWFKLPVGEERVEFYAHIYRSDKASPREARFRTVPAKLSEPVVAALKKSAGIRFPKSPYEIWPLLSSPCDLFSLGVMSVRILLANSQANLPVILDEMLSLARRFGDVSQDKEDHLSELKSLLEQNVQLLDLVSPHALIENAGSPKQARTAIVTDIWLETICLLLRSFPDTGSHSFCKSFGDVSPLALETVFDRPIQDLELLLVRLRSILTPSLSMNEEVAGVLLEQLANN